MSDTPRTDAILSKLVERGRTLHELSCPETLVCTSRQLERELNAANERIKQLEQPITGETSDGYHTFSELYEHRHALFLAFVSVRGGWMSKKHHDGSEMGGWFIAGTYLNGVGSISYHLPIRLWDSCANTKVSILEAAPVWDGHTSQDVINRLMKFATE